MEAYMPRERLGPVSGNICGSHSVYFDEDGRLTVEWYDHGPEVPYESANMLVFDTEQQRLLADALKIPTADRSNTHLLAALQNRFQSYFQVQDFCKERALGFTKIVDFWP
jgi:hypothetical protein